MFAFLPAVSFRSCVRVQLVRFFTTRLKPILTLLAALCLSQAAFAGFTTTTTLTTSATSTTYGSIVTLTGKVNNTAASGTVTFFSTNGRLGTGTLTSGVATLQETGLPVGTDPVTAVYNGDSTYATSTSSPVTITVAAATTAVGSTSANQQMVFNFTSTVTLNSTLATAIQALTQGTSGLDFTYASGGTCAAGASYISGQSCTVNFTFSPRYPGPRLGSIVLYNSATTPAVVATGFVGGTGTGPQALFSTPVISTLATGLSQNTGLSIDGPGNVYMSEQNANQIDKFTYNSGTGTYTKSVPYTGISFPGGTLIDAAGNFYYVSQVSGGGIYEVLAGTTTPILVTSLPSGLYPENNLTQDGAGNIYVPAFNSSANETIYTLNPAGTRTLTALGSVADRTIGIALDSFGNIFLAGTYNTSAIYEIPAGGGTATTLNVTVSSPNALTFDPAGNLYVANNGPLIKLVPSTQPITASTTFTVTTLASGISNGSLVIDAAGTLYTTLTTGNGTLSKVSRSSSPALSFASTAVGATSAAQTLSIENDGNAALTISSIAPSTNNFTFAGATAGSSAACGSTLASAGICGLSAAFTPRSATALAANGVVTDNTLNVAGSTQTVALSGTGTVGTKTITFAALTSPAVAGTSATLSAYASDNDPVTFTVTSGTATIGTVTSTTTNNVTTYTALITYTNSGSVTVAADSAATANATAAATVSQSVTVTAAPTSFTAPTTAVGSTSATQMAEVTFTTAGTPSTISVTAQGVNGLDYAFVSGGSCSTSTAYTVGQTCTVQYTFAPVATGIRYGAATLASGSTVLGSSFLSGTGTGAVAGFTQSAITGAADGISGTAQLTALVVSGTAPNASGNGNVLYIPVFANHILYKYTIGTGATTFYNGGSGTYGGAAVDAAGNVYVSNYGGNRIYKISAAGTLLATWPASGSALSGPTGMVFGTDGTLYVGNAGGGNIIAITPAGVASVAATTGYTYQAFGLAIDGSNNLYLADQANARILKVPGNGGAGGAATVVSVTGTTLTTAIFGVAIDSAGYLYVTNNNGPVLRITPAGVASVVASTGLSNSTGVTTDNRGHIYVTDQSSSNLFTLTLASPPALAFGSVAVGSASTAQTETLFNSGNASLAIASAAASTSNFGFSGTACGATLVSESSCNLSATFTPQASGPLTANGIVTDNALNVSVATQTIVLSGTGTAQQPTITSVSPTSGTSAGGTTVTITGTNLLGITSVKFGTTNAASFTITGGTSLTAVSPAGTGLVDITVSNGTYTSATGTADQFTYLTAQAIMFTQPTTPVFVGATATLVATGGASGNPVTFSIMSGTATLSGTNNSTITYTTAGTVVIAANQAGNGTYLAATQVTRTVTVKIQSVFVTNSTGSVSSFYDNGTTGGTASAQSTATTGGGIGAAVDGSGYLWSINTNGNGISKFTDTGAFSVSYSGGGTAAATSIAIDGLGKVFVTNGNGTVNALTNAGAAVYSTPVAAANAISTPTAISVDAAGSLWIASAGDNSAVELIGVAAPVVTPTVNAVLNANPGTRP